MRILLLSPDPPSPNHINGGTTRQYYMYKRLIELGHEVVVVAPFPHVEDPYIDALRVDGFEVHALQRPPSRLRELLSAIARHPTLLLKGFQLPLQNLICAVYWVDLKPIARQVLAEGNFDLVCLEQEVIADWLSELDHSLPTILTNQQVESVYYTDQADRLSGPTRMLARTNARRARRSERKWTPRFSAVVCMSNNEVRLLKEIVGEMPPSYAIGNGADFRWLAGIDSDPGQNRVLFTGTLSFGPNVLGAEWLAREVWPIVRGHLPDAELQIVGRIPGPSTLALGELDGVTVHASVPDMKPFLAGASVCTLPLLEGGGTRLKLAEALAARRAVVSTTNGATGVDVVDGKDVLIADGVEQFASAIVRLLNDPALRERLGANGYDLAKRTLDWQTLGDRWEEVILEVVHNASALEN